ASSSTACPVERPAAAARFRPGRRAVFVVSRQSATLKDNRDKEGPVLGYDFPLLSLFALSIWWFFLLAVLFAIVWAFIDNFRRTDHSGWAKAGWALLILIVPLIGVLIYLIV